MGRLVGHCDGTRAIDLPPVSDAALTAGLQATQPKPVALTSDHANISHLGRHSCHWDALHMEGTTSTDITM